MEGEHIEGYLDGKKLLDVNDDTFRNQVRSGSGQSPDALRTASKSLANKTFQRDARSHDEIVGYRPRKWDET